MCLPPSSCYSQAAAPCPRLRRSPPSLPAAAPALAAVAARERRDTWVPQILLRVNDK
ncbi:hypothetical protein [Oryza sativa Japonica Group]|uniref:Uncharacterized protein n=1 Tax=Oryza sativa subsp. japonica TaxID=39947 RepID=Q5JM02_ORYSJ|nr:hypothetical protein [Oryza sativa Japonica Group]